VTLAGVNIDSTKGLITTDYTLSDNTSLTDLVNSNVNLSRIVSESVVATDSKKSEAVAQEMPLSIVPSPGRIDVGFDAPIDPPNRITASPSPSTSPHLNMADDWHEQLALDFNSSSRNYDIVRQSDTSTEAPDWDELSDAIELLCADL
jgi:hypothetical protein